MVLRCWTNKIHAHQAALRVMARTVQRPATLTPAAPDLLRKVLVQSEQQVEKAGIPKQRLVQEGSPSVFEQRKEKAPRGLRQVLEGLPQRIDAPAARMMTARLRVLNPVLNGGHFSQALLGNFS